MFKKFFQNSFVYFSTSYGLFLIGMIAVSFGSTEGPDVLSHLGLLCIGLGAAIPPLQRFVG